MKDLYLIRHAQAHSGPSGMDRDFFLTPLGEQQANACGAKLKEIGVAPTHIFCSRLTRARQTAQIISTYVPAPIAEREDLIEHGSKILLMDCSKEEAARKHPDILSPDGALRVRQGPWEHLNWEFSIGGESIQMLHKRGRTAWQAIQEAFPDDQSTILVVSHGSFLAGMLTAVMDLPLQPVWNFGFANAGFMHLRFYKNATTGRMMPTLLIHGPNGDSPDGTKRAEKLEKQIDP